MNRWVRWRRCSSCDRVRVRGAAMLAFILVLTGAAAGQPVFNDVSQISGIGGFAMASGMTGGIAAADYDRDGYIDVFVPNGEGFPDQLYHNLGNGLYEEIAVTAGLASTANHRAALWFDYDGDHDLDLVVAGDCFVVGSADVCPDPVNLRLYRQVSGGTFQDVTQTAGLDTYWGNKAYTHRGGLAAGDIDGDGYLDLFVCGWRDRAAMYVNNQDGTFTDISSTCGFTNAIRYYWQPIMYDFNGDGLLDIFVAVDFDENFLWINNGNQTFTDRAATAGVDNAWNDMGVALGDYDNDGDFDLYLTNISNHVAYPERHSVFYRNETVGETLSFSEIAGLIGVADADWGWGTTFFDCQNNGLLDLAATNGFDQPAYINDQSRFFMNLGGVFIDASASVNFDDTFWGGALIALDHDRDGDLDMMQACLDGPLRLLDNDPDEASAANHYLVVKPRMSGPNYFAIGAVVHVAVGGTNLMRLITAGTSNLGQEPAEAFFGLGASGTVDTVRIEWPDGAETILNNVAADQVLTVNSCPADCADANGVVSVVDLLLLLGTWGTTDPTCNLTGDALVDVSDLLFLLGQWGFCG